MNSMSSRLLATLGLLAFATSSWACGIVYGKDWAFLAVTPAGWSSACHKQAMQGTAITLWRTDQKPDSADSLIYVTVSSKDLPSLEAFASDAIERFKSAASSVKVSQLEPPAASAASKVQLFAFSGAPPGDRQELVAYIEGPTAYFIAVITAESPVALAVRKQDYLMFVSKFSPMERR
jgi:hypothetical protein